MDNIHCCSPTFASLRSLLQELAERDLLAVPKKRLKLQLQAALLRFRATAAATDSPLCRFAGLTA
jgi:hypothetical protein